MLFLASAQVLATHNDYPGDRFKREQPQGILSHVSATLTASSGSVETSIGSRIESIFTRYTHKVQPWLTLGIRPNPNEDWELWPFD